MSENKDNDGQTEGQTKADGRPWTIKNVPPEISLKATNAAKAADVTVAVWIAEAVTRRADQQATDGLIPPRQTEGRPEADALPMVDLAGLAAAVTAAVSATLTAHGTVPKALGRNLALTCNRYMRAALGKPERQTRGQSRGQTGPLMIGSAEGKSRRATEQEVAAFERSFSRRSEA